MKGMSHKPRQKPAIDSFRAEQIATAGLDATRGALMGVTTDVLGYPVDLAASALRPFGYNVEQPVGGSDWLANNLTSPTGSKAEWAGRIATGMITPGPEELLRMGGMLPRKAPVNELITYHGSPHRINNVDEANPYGKFDMSKIGTGEGAQAYGHGVYLAESPDVAKTYANITPDKGTPTPRRFIGDTELSPGTPEYHAASLMDSGRSLASVRKEVASWIKDADSWPDARKASPSEQAMLDGWKRTLATLDSAKSKADFRRVDSGHFYTVDLPDEHIAKMLDWDAPLSEQPEAVRKAIADLGVTPESLGKVAADKVRKLADSEGIADWARRDLLADAARLESAKSIQQIGGTLKRMPLEYGINPDGGPFKAGAKDFLALVKATEYVPNMDTGGGAYGLLSALRGGDAAASQFLKPYGIPGIKYFDGGSRAAGEGTRNFVIFDPEYAKILKRE